MGGWVGWWGGQDMAALARPCAGSWVPRGASSGGAVRGGRALARCVVRMSASERAPSASVLRLWTEAQAVCFDVDSTVIQEEGIDKLAESCGAGEAVAEWTSKAMEGGVTFQEALQARLDLIRPSTQAVETLLRESPLQLSPGVKDLVAALHARGTDVYLISGGFRQMIYPIADTLGVPRENVFANNILFDDATGEFRGFDEAEFTSRSGGKAEAIKHVRRSKGYSTMFMVGDGATDLEARVPGGADAVIGYGGVAVREKVLHQADWFVYSFEPLIAGLSRG